MPVAGRFPAAGATCCRKRIPPLRAPLPSPPLARARHGTRYGGSASRRFLRRLAPALSLSLSPSLALARVPARPSSGRWGWGPPRAEPSRRRAGSGGSVCTRPGSGGGWRGGGASPAPSGPEGRFEASGYLWPSVEVRGWFACPRRRGLGKLAASPNIFRGVWLARGGFCGGCCGCGLLGDFLKERKVHLSKSYGKTVAPLLGLFLIAVHLRVRASVLPTAGLQGVPAHLYSEP